MKKTRKIYLKMITATELEQQWGFRMTNSNPIMFIRSNKQGTVNWDKGLVYKRHELKPNMWIVSNDGIFFNSSHI